MSLENAVAKADALLAELQGWRRDNGRSLGATCSTDVLDIADMQASLELFVGRFRGRIERNRKLPRGVNCAPRCPRCHATTIGWCGPDCVHQKES